MSLWRFLTFRPDLVVIGDCSDVGLSDDSIGFGADSFIEGDDGRIGESAHWGLEGGSCSRGLMDDHLGLRLSAFDFLNRRQVSSVGRESDYRARGLGFEPQTGPTLRS